MIPLILSYPIETASAVGLLLGGLYWKFAPDREMLWGLGERWCRANRMGHRTRKAVWNEGVEPARGPGCLSHLVGTVDRGRG